MEYKDYYEILELDNKASNSITLDDIKKAYKKLAIEWHPDKNQNPQALEKFKNISEAYQILSNTQKKTEYDQLLYSKTNSNNLSNFNNPNNFNNHNNFQKYFHKQNLKDPFEIFNEMFSFINDLQKSILTFNNIITPNNTIHIINIEKQFTTGISNDLPNIFGIMKYGFNLLNNQPKSEFDFKNSNNIQKKYETQSKQNINSNINIDEWKIINNNGVNIYILNDNKLNKIIDEAYK